MRQRKEDNSEFFARMVPPKSSRPTLYFERTAIRDGFAVVAGVDEVGRGALAGPVVAAAVVLEPGVSITGLQDSKLMPAADRERVARRIRRRARFVAIAECSPSEIDTLNILWASLEAMRKAILGLSVQPDYLLIDGNKSIPGIGIPHKTIISGDARSRSIAAASIIAKCHRDALMQKLHQTHAMYGWDTNVGYGTRAHYEALDTHGPCVYHRRSFRLQTAATTPDLAADQFALFDESTNEG